jgi:hypothetical protein
MPKRHNPEDSLGLPFQPVIFMGQNHTARATVSCSVVDSAIMHRNNVCCAQLAISIWITWWVDRVKGQEKQVVEFDKFFDVMLNPPQVMVTVRQLHTVWLERIRP